MAQRGQVRTVCYEVLQRYGRISIRKVRERLRELGLPQGKTKDLLATIREYKRDLEEVRMLGEANLNALTSQFARDVKRFTAQANLFLKNATKFSDNLLKAWAGNRLIRRDLPTDGVSPRRRRKRVKKAVGPPKSELLKKDVERILDVPRKGKPQVMRPISANDLLRLLRPEIGKLFEPRHFSRSLQLAAETSTTLHRLPDRKWWRNDRPLPNGSDAVRKTAKKYVSRGTPLSNVRSHNQVLLERALTVLIKSRAHLGWRAIGQELGIPDDQHAKFRQVLRNHIRGQNPRFYRDANGLYYVSKEKPIHDQN